MRIVVQMPNWLGDAVMATPALENLRRHFPDAELLLVGPRSVLQLFEHDSAYTAATVDDSRKARVRLCGLWRLARSIVQTHGQVDLAIALPNSFSSRMFLRFLGARHRAGTRSGLRSALLLTHPVRIPAGLHQAEIYNQIINGYLGTQYETGPMRLRAETAPLHARPTIGVNPGAAYGSAKRWPAERYAEVAAALAAHHDIVIFGNAAEAPLAAEIESHLRTRGVSNYQNLAGKTTIAQLLSRIAALDLIITNDSGPMHIAAALAIPSVTIFGPTSPNFSRPWRHDRIEIVQHPVPCSPCFKRVCPLEHHACMLGIEPAQVVNAARRLLERCDLLRRAG